MKFTLFFSILFCLGCVPAGYYTSSNSSDNHYTLDDFIYDESIHTVQIYSSSGTVMEKFSPPVIALNSRDKITLEFDQLGKETKNFFIKILHCNADWKESNLSSLDFLGEYNEFIITDYQLSLDTKVPYIHYQIQMPKIILSGNYLAVVYEEGYPENYVLTRRFLVYDNLVSITPPDNITGMSTLDGHRINFNILYTNYEIENPYEYVKVTLRQNNRWDNMISDIKPRMVREEQKKLEYMFFDHSNTFNPGNEFRYFDLRSIVSPGQFVLNLDRMATPYMANIIPDKPRTGLAYTYTPDYNGWYLISNRDSGNSDYYGDYVKVSFTLEANEPYNGDVYIQGALTNWKMSEENRMVYSAEQRAYQCTLLLKQGWYDYQYVIKEPTGKITNLEGNFIDTENYYEIAVYYTPPASRSDLLVGYYRFGINQRP